ncbi:MAG: NUDIX hydrolase [Eubacterium sp.]|nr:NUDIX hydrolase [Eubacterium sp.]
MGIDDQNLYKLQRLNRRLVYSGSVLDVYKDRMQLPDGKIEEWDFVSHKKGGGACIVPVLPDERILMVRQYRPVIDRETLELPAGAIDPGDVSAEQTAKRELQEETGYIAKHWTHLLTLKTAAAYCNEYTDVYLAQNLVRKGEQQLDEAEEIRLEALSLTRLHEMIFRGEIQDAKTVAGILAYMIFRTDK